MQTFPKARKSPSNIGDAAEKRRNVVRSLVQAFGKVALLALLYYNSHAENLVAFKPEATARAGVSPRRPGCSDHARQLQALAGVFYGGSTRDVRGTR
jgi:hypothetical protein